MSDIKKWTVLSHLNIDIFANINRIYIFGSNGKQVIIVANDDSVYAFGDNSKYGCLGLGHTNAVQQPTKLEELCGKQVIHFDFSGDYFALSLTQNGSVYSWGYNAEGECGNGNTKTQLKPEIITALNDKNVINFKCGDFHVLALTKSGDVYIWGYRVSNTPIKMKSVLNHKITSIACGWSHALALTDSGNVYAWGGNSNGQLGNGSKSASYATNWCQIKNIELGIVKIACGQNHSVILSRNGNVYCFGRNDFGQCGDGTNENRLHPVKINDITKFVDIAAVKYNDFSIGLSDNGLCYVWGECGQQKYNTPIRIAYNNINEVIEYYSKVKVTYKPICLTNNLQDFNNSLILKRINEKFNNCEYSDIVFKVENKLIYAFKPYLSMVCKHFEDMFADNKWIESKQNEIEIKDYSFSVYFAFIKYLYTNTVDIKGEEAIQLLDLANCYLEDELKLKCVEIIKNMISAENVMAVYYSADKYNSINLKEYCIEYFYNNAKDKLYIKTLFENAIKLIAK